MLLDPVGITDIAARAGVKPDTVKKWIDRHSGGFPQPRGKAGRSRLWEWADVDRWLRMSGRLPAHHRYRDMGGMIVAQGLRADTDDRDRWVTLAAFVGDDSTSWTAYPKPALAETTDDPQGAAQRLLDGWIDARVGWVRDHPDEPMPAHLVGTRKAIYSEDVPVDAPEGETDPDVDALRAERQRLSARLAEIDARLGSI